MIVMNRKKLAEIKDCLKYLGIYEDALFYKDLFELTTIGTGGKCLCYININNKSLLVRFLKEAIRRKIKFFIIGDGSNIIFGDGIQDSIIIRLAGEFDYLRFVGGDLIKVGAGYNLQKFIVKLAKNNFDVSFLGGIPGTIGGAVMGNSGTAKEGINDNIESIEYISVANKRVEKKVLKVRPGDVRYRSFAIENPAVLTDIILRADRSDSKTILNNLRDRIKTKKRNQPLDSRNAGCFFKNPEKGDLKTGALIDACGLKGFSYGGARVSEKHANFIENVYGKKSGDIIILSKIIKYMVKKRFNIKLEYEVKMVGSNGE